MDRNLIAPLALLCLLVRTAMAQAPVQAPVQQETPAPSGFPTFAFAGHDEDARTLSRFLWRHFDGRLGNNMVLFNKEYLTTADLWMAGAVDKGRGKSIQEIHREDLGNTRVHEDGYVDTHQHFSHANDYGWPFPLWTQSDRDPARVAGKTVGWHFQTQRAHGAWIYDYVANWRLPQYMGETATRGWELSNLRSDGLKEERWQLSATGPSPTLTTPAGMELDAFNSPYLQLRWLRTGVAPRGRRPYIEFLRDGDVAFGKDRRVDITAIDPHWKHITGVNHSIVPMFRHPLWKGRIKRLRLCLAPGESNVSFSIDSLFTAYDTRHTINNPIFILACWEQFRWTGDVEFLKSNVGRMRSALRLQQTEMGGKRLGFIRNPWPGHDGLPGWVRVGNTVEIHAGHGIGADYWDILPIGGDDMYATNQYHAALLAMAELETAVRSHPEWKVAQGESPASLRAQADRVKRTANQRFWDPKAGRFVACIDTEGKPHDYGFTFLNLDSIWYGVASDEHARSILDWISGRRTVEGDTSTGADIYHWRFGPRATTRRNIEWYSQGWWSPESIPWGGQVQDGGAVLGFSFYDMMARLKVLGPDDAWQRLQALLAWDREVMDAGGYRKYYADGSKGTTLQGGGTAGGIGVDVEFFETSLVPSIVTRGFMGLRPTADALAIRPTLPADVPSMGIKNLLYHGNVLNITVATRNIDVHVVAAPSVPIKVDLGRGWASPAGAGRGPVYTLSEGGVYHFVRE